MTIAALVLLGSCETKPANTASSGASPAVSIAVGPLPGYAQQPPKQANPFANDAIAIAQGRRLFVQDNCYGCHGGHGGGGMGPSLRDPVWIYGSSDAEVFASIAQGRGKGMPSWGSRLSDEQIWQLVAYIKTLRTPLEADPPEQK